MGVKLSLVLRGLVSVDAVLRRAWRTLDERGTSSEPSVALAKVER
jgi:hypothetical protein